MTNAAHAVCGTSTGRKSKKTPAQEWAETKCKSKVAYNSKNQALLAKYKYDREFDVVNGVYQCKVCNKWHLTTHPDSYNNQAVPTAKPKEASVEKENVMDNKEERISAAINYHEEYPQMTAEEIAKLTDLSVDDVLKAWAPEEQNHSVDARAITLKLSQISEELITTRNLLIELFGAVSVPELFDELKRTNRYLDVLSSEAVENINPDRSTSKKEYADKKNRLQSIRS